MPGRASRSTTTVAAGIAALSQSEVSRAADLGSSDGGIGAERYRWSGSPACV